MDNAKKKSSVKKNYIYNSIYQIFTILVPIITTPYISQVLLADGIGKYSYTYSIVSFFVLFAQLGFGYYAQREIAKVQNDKYKQSIIFYEIMIIKTISVLFSVLVYIILCLNNTFGEYTILMWLWILLIFAQEFDIAFLFQGNEDFKKIVFRNLFIKLCGIILIFVFVKKPSDVWIYVLSISLTNLLGAISMWFYLPKFLCKIKKSDIHPIHHLKPTIQLFIPTIAAVVYSYFDKTLIGTLIDGTYVDELGITRKLSELENGFYEQAEKIVKVGTSLITALGAVMLPRNSKVYADGNMKQLTSNIYKASRFVFMLGCPIMFGLAAVAPNLVPWFLGDGFEKCILYLRIFCPLVILIGIDNILGIQYLLTTNREKKYTIAIVTGTCLNIILNILLIPIYYGFGAIIASVFSEIIIIILMYYHVRKEIKIKNVISNSKKYFISGFIMFAIIVMIQSLLKANIISTMILIFIGALIYTVSLYLLKDELFISSANIIFLKLKIRRK